MCYVGVNIDKLMNPIVASASFIIGVIAHIISAIHWMLDSNMSMGTRFVPSITLFSFMDPMPFLSPILMIIETILTIC